MGKVIAFWLALGSLAFVPTARAEEPKAAALIPYTVVKGDTCASVALKAANHGANQGDGDPDRALLTALDALPGKLQQFAAAAEASPGLVHRIHGNLRLDTILMAPPRKLTVVEFDGDESGSRPRCSSLLRSPTRRMGSPGRSRPTPISTAGLS